MKSKRFLATLPVETAEVLEQFTKEQDINASIIAQRAVTKMSGINPTPQDVEYTRGETVGVQLSFSDTAYRLLEMWHTQTNISKSKLVMYSLNKTIVEKGQV